MRIATGLADLAGFRDETRDASAHDLKPVPLADQNDWRIEGGALSHRSRGFFHVAGALDDASGEERLVLHQPQAAITCLAVHVDAGRVYVLTQARTEPGNCEQVQYGPTIQSTPANYLRLHGGAPTRHVDCFIDCVPGKARPLAQSSQLDLGNRYFQKIKTVMYVEASDWLETGHDLVWAPLDVLAEALERDHFLNIDFRAMLACFDWDAFRAPEAALHRDAAARRAPLPLDPPPSGAGGRLRLAGLDALRGFTVTPHGVEPRAGEGPSVRMYHAVCHGREKAAWFQPLYEAPGLGDVTLATREATDGRREFLLTRVFDPGLAGHRAWTTTIDAAPEHAGAAARPAGRVLRTMELSEEGGRFLHNRNRYDVLGVDAGHAPGPGQHWLDAGALRHILHASNEATIHLRCAASLVLDALYPETFGALATKL